MDDFGAFYEEHVSAVTAYVARITERGSTGLAEALANLPESQREAVLRRVLAEQEYPEIAEHVGCSEQVVRQRVSRGLAALRRGLEAR
jgi:RNA polymerase sigma factor (sigma-70 family)